MVVDGHEIFRAACSALLRTEGLAVADMAPGEDIIDLARALEPDVVVLDAGADMGLHDAARQLRALACAPRVLLTSSVGLDRLDPVLSELPFLAKADLCAEAILRAIAGGLDEMVIAAESE